MRKMKKALAVVLAAAMTMSMGMTAFADLEVTNKNGETVIVSNQDSVTITKIYKLQNAGTTSPAETFTVRQVGVGVVKDGDATSAPALGDITGAEFAEGEATVEGTPKNITIELPEYSTVGVYEYTLEEIEGTTAGVVYRSDKEEGESKYIKLVVTVMQDGTGKCQVAAVHTESEGGTKKGTIENTYQAAGVQSKDTGLKISKEVTGNLGDHDKYFKFTVTLTGEADKNYGTYAIKGGSYNDYVKGLTSEELEALPEDAKSNPSSVTITKGETSTVILYLKDTDTITIENLPYGVSYTVTETDYTADGYTTQKDGDSNTIGAPTYTAAFINDKTGAVDTGIILDSMPYMALLAVVALGMGAVVLRKRDEDLF